MPNYLYTFTVLDAYNRKKTKKQNIEAASFNDALTAQADFETDFNAAMGVKIIKGALSQDVSPASAPTPDALSNVDEGVSFKCVLEGGGNKAYTLKFPGPRKDYVNTDGSIDLANANLSPLLDDFTGALNPMRVSDGETISVIVNGVLDK